MGAVMIEILRWVAGGLLLLLGGYISAFGVLRLFINARNQRRGVDRHVSGMPILGPLIFLAGWWISPLDWTNWALMILVFDLDTLILPPFVLYVLVFNRESQSTESEDAEDRSSADR